MTDEEALQQAAEAAEAEVLALEAEIAAITARRGAMSREALAAAWARHQVLTRNLQALVDEEHGLKSELARLEHQLARPGFRLPAPVATPLTWYLRATAFAVFAGSVVAAHRYLHSAGLALAALVGLPVAFLAVMVAGSLRESGVEDTPGERAGQGEEPAGLPAVDERAIAAPGGPGDDGSAQRGGSAPREGEHGGD